MVSGPRGTVGGFDALGRVTGWSNGLGTFTPTYVGKTGRVDWLTQPGGRKLDFDWEVKAKDFRLKQMQAQDGVGAPVAQYDYIFDEGGRIEQWRQWNEGMGLSSAAKRWVPSYDGADQLKGVAIKNDAGTAVVDRYQYFYDDAGNRYATRDQSWAVNELNQVTSQGAGGPRTLEGTVSKASTIKLGWWAPRSQWMEEFATVEPEGDHFRWKKDVIAYPGENSFRLDATETTTSPGFEPQSRTWRVVLDVAAHDISYDDNGNMTDDGATRTFEWDAANRLVAINYTGTAKRSEFTYDGLSRRVGMKELDGQTVLSDVRIVWEGMEEFEERDTATNAVLKRFFAEGEQRFATLNAQPTTLNLLYTRDHLGSVREVHDVSTGQLMARYDYDPYGVRTKAGGVAGFEADFGFTGHWHHEASGLELAPYRAYDSALGRWISRDPIGEEGGINLYGYVGGQPISFTDPLGLVILLPADFPGFGIFSPEMYSDAAYLRQKGHEIFPREVNSAYRHAWASEGLATKWGIGNARVFGGLNEVQGFLWYDLWSLPSRMRGDTPWAFQWEDLMNNEVGFENAECQRQRHFERERKWKLQNPPSSRPKPRSIWEQLLRSIILA